MLNGGCIPATVVVSAGSTIHVHSLDQIFSQRNLFFFCLRVFISAVEKLFPPPRPKFPFLLREKEKQRAGGGGLSRLRGGKFTNQM